VANVDDQKPSPNRRLRFSLRDLLWFLVIVAMAFAWWLDHNRLVRYLDLWQDQQAYLDAQMERQIKINAAKSKLLVEAEAKELEEWRKQSGKPRWPASEK
jgi:hypothetical protein